MELDLVPIHVTTLSNSQRGISCSCCQFCSPLREILYHDTVVAEDLSLLSYVCRSVVVVDVSKDRCHLLVSRRPIIFGILDPWRQWHYFFSGIVLNHTPHVMASCPSRSNSSKAKSLRIGNEYTKDRRHILHIQTALAPKDHQCLSFNFLNLMP
jgi:hypothetical protein